MVLASLSPLSAVARMSARNSAFQSKRFLAQAVSTTPKIHDQAKPSSYKVVVVGKEGSSVDYEPQVEHLNYTRPFFQLQWIDFLLVASLDMNAA